MASNYYILLIPLLPFIGFLINGSIAVQRSRGKGFISTQFTSFAACLMPSVSFALSLLVFITLLTNDNLTQIALPKILSWMVLNGFSVNFGFLIDHLSSLMLLVVTGVGSLIHFYSIGYMKDDPAFARYMAYLNLFLFFMITLVMADSLPLLFVGWEGVGLCSYLLIGFWFTDKEKAQAGKKAFIVNRIGDFGFLIGMFAIVATFTSQSSPLEETALAKNFLDFSYLFNHQHLLGPSIVLITLCLFFGATGKSAQIPLYVWLPDAMAGPTPVSALIHAATMVTAGIYMIARLSFLFVMAPFTLHVIATIGALTAFFAALIAITQYDIKKILAYSTVSQLGYMFLALGVSAFSASIFHVMTHAFFKAGLFLCAGSVIHSLHHEQDIRFMGGLWKKMPKTAITFLIFTLAISGIPPLSGFFSKDEILYMTYANAPHISYYILGLVTAGLTAFYMMRLFVYTFLGETRYEHPENIHESPWTMTFPLITLAVLATFAGFIGLPHIFGHSWIGDWLAKLGQRTPLHIPDSTLQEGHLMLISVVWALLCSGLAFLIYRKNLNFFKNFKRIIYPLYSFASNKFRVDEFYTYLIVKPIKLFSDYVLYRFFDRDVIDGLLVNGSARCSNLLGRSLSLLQTGLLGNYLLYLLIAICLMLLFFVF